MVTNSANGTQIENSKEKYNEVPTTGKINKKFNIP